jgi:hypothetical protein
MSYAAGGAGAGSGRMWNSAGGRFGAPTDIASADPRFTLTRAPGYANRPSSLILRSDDALNSGTVGPNNVIAPANFQLALTAPIIGAKAVGVKQAVIRNLIPTVAFYQRWFGYTVVDAGVSKVFVFRYFPLNTNGVLPVVLTQTEFATYLNESAAYAVEVPAGQLVTLNWYNAQLAAGAYTSVYNLIFATTGTDKMALSLSNAAPAGSFALLWGQLQVSAYMAPIELAQVGGVRRYDLMLNNLIGQPATYKSWDGGEVVRVAEGPALVLPEFANINGTQTIYVTSNITANGAQTVSNTSRSIIAVIPVKVEPNQNIVHEPSFIHWIWSVSGEAINEVNIELLDEDLQPINLGFNVLTEIELAFLYEDSRI